MTKRAGRDPAVDAGDTLPLSAVTFRRTPLIDPAVCSLVLISPPDASLSRKSARVQSSYRRKTALLAAAAKVVDVPVFVCCRDGNCPHDQFACEAHACIWKNEAFVEALDAKDSSALVLAGCWLDCEVMMAALYALADRYSVYVPVDASPAQSRESARLAEARLLQYGATPLLTRQVLHEWLTETDCADKRSALNALIK